MQACVYIAIAAPVVPAARKTIVDTYVGCLGGIHLRSLFIHKLSSSAAFFLQQQSATHLNAFS